VNLVANGVSWLLVIAFALVLGGQLLDTVVLVPIWASAPPQSLSEWMKSPAAARVPRFFARLLPVLLAVSVLGLAVALVLGLGDRRALALAGLCGILHMALIFVFFIPTNRALGFLPGAAADPSRWGELIQKWLFWNRVRICLDTVGLIAAVLAVSSSL
jgi:uncharacterized membrane protein